MYVQLKLSLIILLLGCGLGIKAQPLEFGLTGGMNLSTHMEKFRSEGNVDLTPNYSGGYQVGFFVSRDFSELLTIKIEPTFIKLGARYDESFSSQGSEYQTESWTKLLYLQFPFLLQYSTDIFTKSTPVKSVNRYYLTGGVFMGYLLDAHFKGTNRNPDELPDLSLTDNFSNDVITRYSKYDFGTMVGIGLEHDDKIGFETRIQHTIIQSYKGEPLHQPKNLAVTFSFLYQL